MILCAVSFQTAGQIQCIIGSVRYTAQVRIIQHPAYMYLKNIEMQGFKSFANKIRLDFPRGFTAIVGPNGSGKSNVADAVRWVLGEQRVKQLRGGSMQDVIFSGTELRKPLSFAYAAITFDNSDHKLPVDYEEVTVARRLYRSGESEYLLNRAQVRLRDIQELFYDTGIGREGYSIIGQGQIDRVLSEKPEDRRELFDEAAGIVKFKRRKETTLKKLESEQANLARVRDILDELERQAAPLEKQAGKAQIYLRAREELKILDVNLFLREHHKALAQQEKLETDLSAAREELSGINARFEEAKGSYESVQTSLQELENTIERLRGEIAHTNAVRSQLETQIQVSEESLKALSANAEHFHTREESVRSQISEKEREISDLENAVSGLKTLLASMEKFRAEAQEELDAVQAEEALLQERMDAHRGELMQIVNRRGSVRAQLASVQAKREQAESRSREVSTLLQQTHQDEKEQDRELERLQKEADRIAREIEEQDARRVSAEEEILVQKKRLTLADESLRKYEAEYHREKSRMDALVNLTERYEGFGGSVKRVMEEKSREKGLIGVVADLIKTQPKYETAIETALGGSIQNIVTDNEETARRMIELLKREKAGRATFLPLTAVHAGQGFGMMGALKEQGAIGLADTLVTAAPEHRDVVHSLLGRTLVADNYEHAVQISRRYQQKIRIVTLSGELFAPGGAISGGAFRSSSNLLGRRREIADLRKRVKELRDLVSQAEEEIAKAKEDRNRARAGQESARTLLQGLSLEQNTIRMNIAAQEERRRESEEGLTQLREQTLEATRTKEDLDTKEDELQKELTVSEQSEREANAALEQLSARAQSLHGKEDEKLAGVRKWDSEVQKNRQKMEFRTQELARAQAELTRIQTELAEILEGIRSGDASMEEKKRTIASVRETIEASGDAHEQNRLSLAAAQQQRADLTEQQKKIVEERESLSGDQSRMEREIYRLEDQLEKSRDAMDRQINYLWDEYEIVPSAAKDLADASMTDVSAMKTRAEELRGEIKSLGSVNVGAIEEYRQVKERYTFLKTQYDDLCTAAAALEKIAAELDEQMRRQFRTQFGRIREEFDRVFRQFFGGGSGRLELVEGEDLLTAGVRVIAQPPGKKLQNMMQMSGGEKALTAIALLFAIQNLKPSPFCLLDEIEAALDESNVARFAEYLHKSSEHTQFIVITHRRGTMNRADRLYGITMQEKGVSTLVGVDLIPDEDLA